MTRKVLSEQFSEALTTYDKNPDDDELWTMPEFPFGIDVDTPAEWRTFRQLCEQDFRRRAAVIAPLTIEQQDQIVKLAHDFIGIPHVAEYQNILIDSIYATIAKELDSQKTESLDAGSVFEFIAYLCSFTRYDERIPLDVFRLPVKDGQLTSFERSIIASARHYISGNCLARLLGRSTATVWKLIESLKAAEQKTNSLPKPAGGSK